MPASLALSRRERARDELMSKCATREMNISNSVERMRHRRTSNYLEKELRSQEHYLEKLQHNFTRRNFELLEQRRQTGICRKGFNANNHNIKFVVHTVDGNRPLSSISNTTSIGGKSSTSNIKAEGIYCRAHHLDVHISALRTETQQKDTRDLSEPFNIVTPQIVKERSGGVTASTISSSQKAAYSQGLISKDREAELLSALIITPLKSHVPVVEQEITTGTQRKLQDFLDRASMESTERVGSLSRKEEMQRRFSRVYRPEKPIQTKLVDVNTPRHSVASSDVEFPRENKLVLPPLTLPPIHECVPRKPRPTSWHHLDRNNAENAVTEEEWEQLKLCRYLRLHPISECGSPTRERQDSFATVFSEW